MTEFTTYVHGLHCENIIIQDFSSLWQCYGISTEIVLDTYASYSHLTIIHRRLPISNIFNISKKKTEIHALKISFLYILKILEIKYYNVSVESDTKLSRYIIKVKISIRKRHFLNPKLILDLRNYSKFVYTNNVDMKITT